MPDPVDAPEEQAAGEELVLGRKKAKKTRRLRMPRQYTLQDLQPPGEGYEEWLQVTAGMNPDQIHDPRLGEESLARRRRLARLGPLYDNTVPRAALHLDELIDTGHLPIFEDGKSGTLVPLAEAAAWCGSSGDLRESVHRLHANGMLLVETDNEHNVPVIRLVAQKPAEPGQPWRFQGDPDAVTAQTCIPDNIWEDLPIDVAGAVAYMRMCRSQLEEPDPAAFGLHEGVNGTAHARKLFAAALASGAVDEKGCEACPTGHLCTRTEN
ncbi:hypothetical protein ACOKM5_42955 [Streptomyces sp. BH097]|uniref:hypothetical protein n=1 Tax=unclassified Streptomyces TaxID=2593676 RepID=UPI003BB5BCFC